ncbi:MAG: VCBS repeat-containing protein, partial [Planctomycetota bacterium]
VYGAPNLLYVNDGAGVFSERAADFGLAIDAASVMMSFADYDSDGDLDGYLVTNRLVTDGVKHRLPTTSRAVLSSGIVQNNQGSIGVAPKYEDLFAVMSKGQPGRFALVIAGQQDVLLRNEGGKFRSVNREAGISGHGVGLAAAWWDYNGDDRPDLYVSNDYKGADQLYRNNGDGTFTDVVEDICPHVPWFSMGVDVGDVDNDGRMDLFASDMAGTSHYRQKASMGDMSEDAWFLDLARPPQYMRNALFVNTGGRVLEAARMAGLSSSDWTWSPKFGDLDNDGRIDLFVANGMSRDFMDSDLPGLSRWDGRWSEQPILRERNLAFRNQGNLQFEEVGHAWGLDEPSASYG